MRDSTEAIHGHGFFDESTGTFIPPIFMSAMFEQPGWTRSTERGVDLKYSREENPSVSSLERIMTKLEGAEDTLAFSSGMSAISSIYMSKLKAGAAAVAISEAYATSIKLLEDYRKFGVDVRTVWPSTEEIIASIKRDVIFVLLESMTNPSLRVFDIEEIAKAAQEAGTELIVDNTFLSPILYKPLAHGARLVIESSTKYLNGHNDAIGGIVSGKKEEIRGLWDWRRKMGSIMSPLTAYLTSRGLKTLELRVKRESDSALRIARWLSESGMVKEVIYPGLEDNPYHKLAKKQFTEFGGVLCFRVRGGGAAAKLLLKSIKLIKPAPSLGGTESLISYPIISASSSLDQASRQKLGITDDLLRLSLGVEDPEDLMADLRQALGRTG